MVAATPQVEKCPAPTSSRLGLDEGAEAAWSVGVGSHPAVCGNRRVCVWALGAGAGMRWCHDPEAPALGQRGAKGSYSPQESPEPAPASPAFSLQTQALNSMSAHNVPALGQRSC